MRIAVRLLSALSLQMALFFAMLMVVFTLAAASQAGGGGELRDGFIRDAPKQWERYAKFVTNLEGKHNFKRSRDGVLETAFSSSIRQNKSCKMCEVQHSAGKVSNGSARGFVWSSNPAYAFSLRRKNQDAPWALIGIGQKSHDEKAYAMLTEQTEGGFTFLSDPSGIDGESLSDLLQQPTFSVTEALAVFDHGAQSVKVHFDNSHPSKWLKGQPPLFRIQSGILVLDPNLSWLIRSCEIASRFSDGTEQKTSIQIEYKNSASDRRFGIPTHRIERADLLQPNGKRMSLIDESVYELNEITQGPGNEEFTTLAYGIPEPFESGGKTHRYLWIGLAGGVSLSLGAALRWLRHRSSGVV